MRGLALRIENPVGLAVITASALVIALGVVVTRPDLALAMGLGVAVLFIAFISTEAALYILIVSMLLSPEIIIGELGSGAALRRGLTLRLDDFLLVIIGFGWLARTAIYKELGLFLKTPLNRPILYYMLVCVFSTLIGVFYGRVNFTAGLFFVLKFFEFFFVYFMVVNTITEKAQIKRFVLLALVTCFLVSVYAIAQVPAGGRATAPFEGKFGEPNTLGGYLVFMLSIVAGLFLYLQSRQGRILLVGLAGMIGVTLLATQSRASYAALVIIFGIFMILTLTIRRNVWLFSFLAILLLATPYILPSVITERIEYTYSQTFHPNQITILGIRLDTSTSARIRSWQHALEDFKSQPIMGYGVTGYKFLDAQYPKVLIETGLLGMAAFLYLLYRLWQQGRQTYKITTDPYEKGLVLGFLLGFIGLLVHALGANTFIIVRIMEPFWLFAGLVIMLPLLKPQGEKVLVH